MSRPRVVEIITRFGMGGSARHLLEASRRLQEQFEISILTGPEEEGEGSLIGAAAGCGIHVGVIPDLRRRASILTDRRALKQLVEAIRSRGPAIVHTHQSKAGLLGRTAAKRAGVRRVIHTFHSPLARLGPERLRRLANLTAERRLARTSDRLIAVSPSLAHELVAQRIAAPERIEVVLPIVERERLFDLPPRGTLRRRLRIGPGSPLIALVGRLAPSKEPALFLKVLSTIAASVPEVRAVVAGDGPERPALEAEARRRNLASRIFFTGWAVDLPALYADIDLLFVTSRYEGFPLAAFEAMAAGRAVVATSVTGVTDVVVDGATGLLAPPGDASSLAGAGILLLRDTDFRKRIGAAAREEAARRLAGQNAAERLASIYHALLGRVVRRPPASPALRPPSPQA